MLLPVVGFLVGLSTDPLPILMVVVLAVVVVASWRIEPTERNRFLRMGLTPEVSVPARGAVTPVEGTLVY